MAEQVGEWVTAEAVRTKGERLPRYELFSGEKPDHGFAELGIVRWYGAWWGYAFFPNDGTLYEHKCLRAIAEFCERKTQEVKSRWKRAAARKAAEEE